MRGAQGWRNILRAMQAAANKVVPLSAPLFNQLPRGKQLAWRRFLERFLASQGARPALVHVSAEDWAARCAANDLPADAALDELVEVSD